MGWSVWVRKGLKTRTHWAQVLAVSLAYELSPYRALQAIMKKKKKDKTRLWYTTVQ